jgi:hypothetical protein
LLTVLVQIANEMGIIKYLDAKPLETHEHRIESIFSNFIAAAET